MSTSNFGLPSRLKNPTWKPSCKGTPEPVISNKPKDDVNLAIKSFLATPV